MKRSLFSYEPELYAKSKVMRNILQGQEIQLKKAEKQQEILEADMRAATTAHPELWEREYGITPSGSLDQRRKLILAKIRGTDTITKEKVKDIVKVFTDGEVDVTENPDDSMVNIDITSNGTYIEPEDFTSQLYPVIPAHLEIYTKQTVVHEQKSNLNCGVAMETIETIEIM